MQRVNRSSAVVTMPAPPAGGTPGYFTGGNPGGGTPPTTPGYEWFNGVQEELIGLILRGGITASNADLAQVRKSLDRLFGGGLGSFSANTSLSVDDAGLVLVNASGGARTITLPAANALGGRPIRYQIEKTDSTANTVTVQRAGADTIEGATSVVLSGQWASVTLVSDGVSVWVMLSSGDQMPVGSVVHFPGTSAPTGFLKSNGALLNRVSFARLWAYAQASGNLVTDAAWLAANGPIGAFSQGDGSTTFRIPDLRGEFLRGFDDGRGADAGRGIGTFQDGQLLSHGHAITDPTHAHGVAGNNGGTAGIVATYNVANDTAYFLQTGGTNQINTAASSTGITIANTGGAENRPRNIALLACIKF
jgi:microcystin-dependent protein